MSLGKRFVNRVTLGDRIARRLRRWLVGDPIGTPEAQVSYIHAGDSGRASPRLGARTVKKGDIRFDQRRVHPRHSVEKRVKI